MRFCSFLLLLVSTVPAQQPTLATFRNRAASFQIELPSDWQQLAPNQAVQLREQARSECPRVLMRAEPRAFYAVGPVAAWLGGDFREPWLYVVEQQTEWHVDDDFAATLRSTWKAHGEANGEQHELRDIQRTHVGAQQVEAIVALRSTSPRGGGPSIRSLDVHTPAGGQQITLSFQCPAPVFARWEPEFRRWLATLSFARPPRKAASLTDRLWTPVITGAVVFVVLFGLYKHTRGRR